MLLLTGIQSSLAQEKEKNKIAFKAYLNANQHFNDQPGIQSGLMSAAVSSTNKSDVTFEYELSGLEIAVTTTTVTTPAITYGMVQRKQYLMTRFETYIPILKTNRKFVPYCGASVSPYMLRINDRPFIQDVPRTSFQEYGLQFSVIPRVIWNMGPKWFLDLNMPVRMINGSIGREVARSQLNPGQQQTTALIEIKTMADLAVRFGLGLRL
jgi:hypothetical protein